VTESSPLFTDYKTSNRNTDNIEFDSTLSSNSNVIPDADVSISNGTVTANLIYDKKYEIYKISTREFSIRSGVTYNLVVKSKGRTAQATCTVPPRRAQIQSFTIDSTSQSSFGFSRNGYKVQFNWVDNLNQPDTYRVRAYLEYEYLEPNVYEELGLVFEEKIRRTAANWNGRFTDTDAYISDLNKDGKNMESPVGTIFPNLPNRTVIFEGTEYRNKYSEKKPRIVIELLTIEENYHQYHLSIIKHENSENNPFAEPYSVYSNVKGGLGCFGASNRRILSVQQF
jgi:hypothetical protein